MAVDPDGDSLSYELVAPLGAGATPLIIPALYIYPDQIGGGNFSVDALSLYVIKSNLTLYTLYILLNFARETPTYFTPAQLLECRDVRSISPTSR